MFDSPADIAQQFAPVPAFTTRIATMAFIIRAFRSNPHLVNYALIAGAIVVPVMLYVEKRSPTQSQIAAAIVRTRAGSAASATQQHCGCTCVVDAAAPPRPCVQEEAYPEQAKKAQASTQHINDFWKTKRTQKEMDVIYDQLLRSGKSKMARQHELSGALSDVTAAQDPEYARMRAALSQPAGEAAMIAGSPVSAAGAPAATAAAAAAPTVALAATHPSPSAPASTSTAAAAAPR